MKKLMLAATFTMLAATMSFAISQYVPTSDVLGAHLVYGRGCVACHSPHSGALGNGIATTDATTGSTALWGADVQKFETQTFGFGEGTYAYTSPANMSAGAHDSQVGIMLCLSCHDGNLAKNGMMKGTTVETIPNAIGGNAPTLLGNDGTTAGNYGNDHPVGPLAIVSCGTKYTWDCVNTAGVIAMTGTGSAAFKANYGFTVALSVVGGNATVTCMSCHDQHSMNAYNGTIAGVAGTYKSMFFIKGYYDPTQGNSAAQFCRQCHGGEGNEMHNALAIPTV